MRIVLYLFLVLAVGPLTAQDNTPKDRDSPPELVVKMELLQLASPFKQAVGVQMDYRFAPHHRFDMAAGLILDSQLFADEKGESYQGPRVRIGWKFAFVERSRASLYTGLEFGFDDITHRYYDRVQRQGNNYTEHLLLNRHLTSLSGTARFGVMIFLGKDRRFMIEPEIKLGVAQHNVTYRNPNDVVVFEPRTDFFNVQSEAGQSYVVLPSVGFHIGYVLIP